MVQSQGKVWRPMVLATYADVHENPVLLLMVWKYCSTLTQAVMDTARAFAKVLFVFLIPLILLAKDSLTRKAAFSYVVI